MSEPRRITSEDLALFAMQLLSLEEAREIAAYLEHSADARRELAEIQGDLGVYAHTVEMHPPPSQSRDRMMNQVAREKKPAPINQPVEDAGRSGSFVASGPTGDLLGERRGAGRGLGSGSYLEEEQPKRSVAAKVVPWIGWAIAAGLAITTGDLYHERDALRSTVVTQTTQMDHLSADAAAARQVLDAMTDNSAMQVTLTQKGQAPAEPQGRATYVANKGTLIFIANNLQPIDPSKTYELWLIPAAAGENPIPAGTFRPDARGNASVIMPPLPKGVEAKAFGVTIEDAGGSTTPTLPIILAGT